MSLYNGPARGGNRGGKDQFNWDAVKADKDREFYLGHSVKATTGRWQKGKDVFWYTRAKGEDGVDPMAAELRSVKEREEELMMEALGMKPKVKKLPVQPKLDQRELAQLTQAGEDEGQGPLATEDRLKGIGYAPNQAEGQVAGHEVLAGSAPMPAGAMNQGMPLPPPPPRPTAVAGGKRKRDDPEKAQRKAERKAARQAKKVIKQEKKAAKKAAKAAKAAKAPADSSSDDSDAEPSKNIASSVQLGRP
ncbi:hypothetical protein WJX73_002172 [Symbiochloris irregularis]|uniref:Multiple myeloma tumor-associated protein 2-like N-terminal domain-containing protein n=1 Tax=Symbiochloris irregularis TaxID=706552 RepID=A0AAW1P2J7_9CHLO